MGELSPLAIRCHGFSQIAGSNPFLQSDVLSVWHPAVDVYKLALPDHGFPVCEKQRRAPNLEARYCLSRANGVRYLGTEGSWNLLACALYPRSCPVMLSHDFSLSVDKDYPGRVV